MKSKLKLTHLPTHSHSETQTVTRERKKIRKGSRCFRSNKERAREGSGESWRGEREREESEPLNRTVQVNQGALIRDGRSDVTVGKFVHAK